MRALICDDDFVLHTLEHALKKMTHEVVRTKSAQGVLDSLRHSDFRLVITDWEMPGMDGIELCEAIRREDLAGYVYVIMLTSNDNPEQRMKALCAGVDDFIVKPFSPAALKASLNTAERVLSLETRDLAMFAMAKLAESRDPETGAHIERVQSFSRVLAQQLSTNPKHRALIDPEYVRLIYQTSPLHDIGKVGIPDSVLLKPGKLNAQEFEAMKTHVQIGRQTLDAALQRFPNARFLQMARDIAATHHEKFDGTGYPEGLVGDSIPLSGRIVAVADVYDALTSKRIYKTPISHQEARLLIVQERGKHFDPDVVEAFLYKEQQFIGIRQRLSDERDDAPKHRTEYPPPSASPGPSQILVVEDDPILRDSLSRLLSQAGYSVLLAANGTEAIRILAEENPHVVISDWEMPEVDGLELCRHVRARVGAHVHFLMLTMHSNKDKLVSAFDAGVDDFISKPFDEEELIVRVRAGIRTAKAQDELHERHRGSRALNEQLASLNNRLERLAITDDLTGLFNRRHAMVRLDEQWALAERYGRPLTIAMCDIDHFKAVNDTHGHEVGDAVLRSIAEVLKDQTRLTDTVCRVGGEEFLIIFPAETTEQVKIFADRCCKAVRAHPIRVCGTEVRVTVSMGIASRVPKMATSSELLNAADVMLYSAKRAGRNRVVICSEDAVAAEPPALAGQARV